MNIQTEIKPCLADYPDALTVDEVIAILRVSRKTMYELIKTGASKRSRSDAVTASQRRISSNF